MNDRIVIGVPGRWSSRTDLVTSIASRSGGYLFAGQLLMEVATSATCELELDEHHPGLRRAFEIAGGSRFTHEQLDQISEHTLTAYLVGRDLSLHGAGRMRKFAAALLRSGGLAVKVESTGVAHGPEAWLQGVENESVEVLYSLYHTYVGSSGYYYSCGMKNFGLPDCSVDRTVESAEAARTMHVFNHYQLTESPTFENGHTFSTSVDARTYILSHHRYGYEPDDPLDNPFGRWHLNPAV